MSIELKNLSEKNIKLVELSDTWQGEGPDTGRQMTIAIFKYCNRFCKFCDTWIKMKTTSEGSYSIEDINKALEKTKGLMITGGEPTYNNPDKYITNLDQTLYMLTNCLYQVVNIETNGCDLESLIKGIESNHDIKTEELRKMKIIYSPKIFDSKDFDIEILKTKRVINKYPYLYFKIVADGNPWSEKYIKEISPLCYDRGKIYLMPLGLTPDEITKNWQYCIDMADEMDVNLSSRMHIMNQFT